jgi:hypothetical protein
MAKTVVGMNTSGNIGDANDLGPLTPGVIGSYHAPRLLGIRTLFVKKQPGSPGKLGKTSTRAESLSKLRGKGALA